MNITAKKVIIRWDNENWIWRMEYQGPSKAYTIRTTLKRPIDYNASDDELKALAIQELELDGLALPKKIQIVRYSHREEVIDENRRNKTTTSPYSLHTKGTRKTVGRR